MVCFSSKPTHRRQGTDLREVFFLLFFKADSTKLKSIYRTNLKTTTVDQSAVQPKITKALNIFYFRN